ncbi:MAG: UDP-N-acetylmuramate--L-alanine ligase [Anaerolineae bacterium]|nr:UDP-N-acetylmuramate--L-alanine ligase [Anaerolineae bacterium]
MSQDCVAVEMPAIPRGAHIHIVGIGGSGMSAIARVLLERGDWHISGSDRSLSEVGRGLADLGARVYDGHRAEQVGDADFVFVSSAIPQDNVEVQEARGRGIPVIRRPQVLAWLTEGYDTIGVAGTHGKTTTTAMISAILLRAGLDPSFIVGGVVPELGTNAHAGRGRHFVIEADEYERTFLALRPSVAVVTNVEMDHPDCFPTYADVQAAFGAYLGQTRPGGWVIACADDPGGSGLLGGVPDGRRTVRYGLGPESDVRAVQVLPNGLGYDFDVVAAGEPCGRFSLQVPGLHNVRNALAALSVARELGVSLQVAREALVSYRGVARRFELKGEVAGITVIDDYAHHPTEIRATLAAARARYHGRTIWAVFQPHTFSRTQALLEQYRRCFDDADHVLITPIYAARERDDRGVSSADLVRDAVHKDMRYVPDLEAATRELVRSLKAGDVLVTMGAGDSFRVGEGVLSTLQERAT